MRPNGFGGPHFRPPSAQSAPAYPRQDNGADQAGPDLLSPSGSVGPQIPAQNGWPAPGSKPVARPAVPPPFGAQRAPAGNLAGGLGNLSNGGPAQSALQYSKPPIGGGEYVQQSGRPQHASVPPPARQAAAPGQSALAPGPPRAGLPGRGPPAFGKPTLVPPAVGQRPPGPGSVSRPASPSSPNKYASIRMPASPSPTTSRGDANHSQQQAAQMPLPPSQSRSLAPPSFSRPQQVHCNNRIAASICPCTQHACLQPMCLSIFILIATTCSCT